MDKNHQIQQAEILEGKTRRADMGVQRDAWSFKGKLRKKCVFKN